MILLNSDLNDRFELVHFDNRAHESLESIGTWDWRKAYRNVGLYARLTVMAIRRRPDVVLIPISQSTMGFFKDSVFVLIARILIPRTVLHLHGSNLRNWLASASAATRAYFRAVVRGVDGVIVLGESLRNLFEGFVPSDRIFVVPNGANYTESATYEAEPDQRLRVLYLANLVPSKGIEDVVGAVAVLKRRGVSNFTVHVVGAWRDAGTRGRCTEMVESEQLPIQFHGPIYGQEKFHQLSMADVFIFLPREPEGHPWVIVEALWAGLPIVATDQGAIRESVRDNVNGFIVEPRNPEAAADGLESLVLNDELRARMGRESRQLYLEEFTEARMVQRMAKVFDAVLSD